MPIFLVHACFQWVEPVVSHGFTRVLDMDGELPTEETRYRSWSPDT